jgi:hypothetical protein
LTVFFFKKRTLSRDNARAANSKSKYDNSKIKVVLKTDFKSVKEYSKSISSHYF